MLESLVYVKNGKLLMFMLRNDKNFMIFIKIKRLNLFNLFFIVILKNWNKKQELNNLIKILYFETIYLHLKFLFKKYFKYKVSRVKGLKLQTLEKRGNSEAI